MNKFFMVVGGLLLAAVAVFLLSTTSQPPVDHHSFRQSQTALSALWMQSGANAASLLSYETPVLGYPWTIPFEFPLYQFLVATIADLFGVKIEQVGRLLSVLFWLSTISVFGLLCRELRLGRRYFFIAAALIIFSPLYLYWSRAILIESCAVFFGFLFVLCVAKAAKTSRLFWWFLSLVSGLLCALIKVTTFPAFGLAAAGCALWITANGWRAAFHLRTIKPLLALIGVGLLIVLVCFAWIQHSDALKEKNALSATVSSHALSKWNYGTMDQRLSTSTWKELVQGRILPLLLGGAWPLGLVLAALPFCTRRDLVLFGFLLLLFMVPFLLFINLHAVHDYYQYANGFWFLMAMAVPLARWTQAINPIIAALVLSFVTVDQLATFRTSYFHFTRIETAPSRDVGLFLHSVVAPDDIVLVFGDNWNSEVAFFSERRCIYIPRWLEPERARYVLDSLASGSREFTGPHKIGAIIYDTSPDAFATYRSKNEIDEYIAQLSEQAPLSVAGYKVFLKR